MPNIGGTTATITTGDGGASEGRELPIAIWNIHNNHLPSPWHSRVDIFSQLEAHIPHFYKTRTKALVQRGDATLQQVEPSWKRFIRCIGNICCYVEF